MKLWLMCEATRRGCEVVVAPSEADVQITQELLNDPEAVWAACNDTDFPLH